MNLEYIQLPKYYNLDYYSEILKDFINDVRIVEGKIDLDFLRKYYMNNNENFIRLRDELLLRNFKFVIKKENNLIYNIDEEIKDEDKIIFVKENKNKYKSLNSILFKYLDYDQINDDRYFNYIPIKYMAKLNKVENENLVEKEFVKLGFDVKTGNRNLDLEEKTILEGDELLIHNKSKELFEFMESIVKKRLLENVEEKKELDQVLKEELSNIVLKRHVEITDVLSQFGIKTLEEYLNEDYISLRKILNARGDKNALEYIKIVNNYWLEVLFYYSSMDDILDDENYLLTVMKQSNFIEDGIFEEDRPIAIKLKFLNDEINEPDAIFNKTVFNSLMSVYDNKLLEYFKANNIRNLFSYFMNAKYLEVEDKKELDNFIIDIISISTYRKYEELDGLPIDLETVKNNKFNKRIEANLDEKIIKNFRANKENQFYKILFKSINISDYIDFDKSMSDKKIEELLNKEVSLYTYYEEDYDSKLLRIKGVGPKGRSSFKIQLYTLYERAIRNARYFNIKFRDITSAEEKDEIKNYTDYFIYQLKALPEESRNFHSINKDLVLFLDRDLQDKLPTLLKNILFFNRPVTDSNHDLLMTQLNKLSKYREFERNKAILSDWTYLLSHREIEVLNARYVENKTLEESGNQIKVTRERVRQIEQKALKKISQSNRMKYFIKSISLFGDKIDEGEMKFIISDMLLYKLIKGNNFDNIFYSELTQKFYLYKIDEVKLSLSGLEDIDEKIERFGYYSSLEEEILNIYKSADENEIKAIINKLKIRTIDDRYFKENMTNQEYMEMYFKYINKSKVRIDEDNLPWIKKDIEGYFGELFFTNTPRNITSNIDRIEEVILVDRRTYQHIDYCGLDREALPAIKENIDKVLEEKNHINANDIYELLIEDGYRDLISKHHAYFLVKYYFYEDYIFSDNNSMTIYKSKEFRKPKIELLKEKLVKYACPVRVKELAEDLNINSTRLNILLSNNRDKNVIKMNSKIGLADKILKGIDLEYLKDQIDEIFKDGYTTINFIYNKFLYDPKLAPIITNNKLENTKELTGIIKYIKPEVRGNNMFLYLEESPIKSMYDLIANEYDERVTRIEIRELLCNEYYLEEQSVRLTVERLLKSYDYIQIDSEEFIRKDKIKLDNDLEEFVLTLVRKNDDMGFIVPNKLIKENTIDFFIYSTSINQYILAYILSKHGYKKLTRFDMSYIEEIIVMVKEDSKYLDIEELVYDLLESDYKGNMMEADIYDYLSDKGIYEYRDRVADKKLFMDVLNKERIQVNLAGRVSIC